MFGNAIGGAIDGSVTMFSGTDISVKDSPCCIALSACRHPSIAKGNEVSRSGNGMAVRADSSGQRAGNPREIAKKDVKYLLTGPISVNSANGGAGRLKRPRTDFSRVLRLYRAASADRRRFPAYRPRAVRSRRMKR